MAEQTKPGWNYWPIVILGLVWNLMGVMNYITQTSAESVAAMPDAYRTLIETRPAWATAAFAVAVFGGAVGCILLILRRSVAVPVLQLSLLGVAVTMAHAIISAPNTQVLIGTAMSLIVAIVLLWVATLARARGWLR